jgi:hypothetical protein
MGIRTQPALGLANARSFEERQCRPTLATVVDAEPILDLSPDSTDWVECRSGVLEAERNSLAAVLLQFSTGHLQHVATRHE